MKTEISKSRVKRIVNQKVKQSVLLLDKLDNNVQSTIISKSLKIEEDIAKKIKLGGALINKSQGDFISILVRDFFENYKTKELGKIIEDIDSGKIKTLK